MVSSHFHSALIQIHVSPCVSAFSGFWDSFLHATLAYVLSLRANNTLIIIYYLLVYFLFLVDMMDNYMVIL